MGKYKVMIVKEIRNKFSEFSTRKKTVMITIFSNLILQIITSICGFILPPLIVQIFGSAINGMVSSITQFIAYLNLVEAGVGAASIAALYKPLAENNFKKRNQILSATSRFYNRSGILFSALVILLAFIYPRIVGSQVDEKTSFLMVLILGITGAAEFFLIGKYRVILTADQKVYVISIVQSAAVILNTLVAVVLIKLGCSIIIVKFVSTIIFLGRFLVLSIYVHKKYEKISYCATSDTASISQSKNALVHQIGGFVVFNSPILIITVLCSLKDASIYAVYAMIFGAINCLLGAFSNGMQSFFGESLVAESIEHTKKLFGKYETFFFVVEGWFYTMAFVLIMPFMKIYTKNMTDTNYIQPIVAYLFVITGVLCNVRNPAGQVINAAGHFKKTQWHCITEVIINIVCSIVFTLKVGFSGVLWGGLCSHLFRAFDVIIYANMKVLKKNSSGSFCKIIFISVLCAVAGFVAKKLFGNQCNSFVEWILLAIKCGIVVALPLTVILFARSKFGNPREVCTKEVR